MSKTIKDMLTGKYRQSARTSIKRENRRKMRRESRMYCKRVREDEEVWESESAPVQDWVWIDRSALIAYRLLDRWMLSRCHDGMEFDQLRAKLSRKFDARTRRGAAVLRRFDDYVSDPDWHWYKHTKLRNDDGVIRRYRWQGGRSWDDINAWLAARSIFTSGKKLFWGVEEFSNADYDFQEELTPQQWEQVLLMHDVTPEPILTEQPSDGALMAAFDVVRDGRFIVVVMQRTKKWSHTHRYFWVRKHTDRYRPLRGIEWNGWTYVTLFYKTEYWTSEIRDAELTDYEYNVWQSLPRRIREKYVLG